MSTTSSTKSQSFFIDPSLIRNELKDATRREGPRAGTYSYELGNYISLKSFFTYLSSFQDAFANNKPIEFNGQTLDTGGLGGLTGVKIALDTIDAAKRTYLGLGSKGLQTENSVLKNLKSF